MRRLNVLEYILLVAAAIASVAGGWLAALLGRSALGLPFRPTWVVASLAFFLIPGAAAWLAERRSANAVRNTNEVPSDEDGQPREDCD